MSNPTPTEAEKVVAELRRTLAGVTCDAFGGDNLAIFLASEFEPGVDSDEMDDSGAWKQGALDLADSVIDAIHAHYVALIESQSATIERLNGRLTFALDEGTSWAVKAGEFARRVTALEAEKAGLREALAPFADFQNCQASDVIRARAALSSTEVKNDG